MTTLDLKTQIEHSIKAFSQGNLRENGIRLLKSLGYSSDRQVTIEPNTFAGFVEIHPPLAGINKNKALTDNWLSVDILFQLTGEDLRQMTQGRLIFDKNRLDNQIIESYLFLAIELKPEDYSRTKLADITREVNKFFAMPVLILFKVGDSLTLSIINRRLHKKDESKDVLEKVTLIKGISIKNPIRAHVEILFDLSLSELETSGEMHSFVELHKAWQKTLDISELNKKFYREIANWYFYAVEHVEFPKGSTEDRQTRNATNIIRLITRLIFVWFIKEKGLVPDVLFNSALLKEILNFNDSKNSTYYKAVLQNLFFATLNTEMGSDRRFRGKNKNPNGLDAHNGISTVYRYEDFFKDPAKGLALFAGIPFLNGGLFECLDKREEKILVDGFSDDPRNQPVVPDSLFFGDELTVDLSEVYGDKLHNKEKVRGLIRIFESYKFTIEENTPLDEEIALDPELLGKVFENLLAAYNPETGTTARKQTGSFYTPREIVNYMVDESLIAYLENSLGGDELNADEKSLLESKLRHLLAYHNEPHQFNAGEADQIISAIDKVKVLDPACGSGAFPMGVLHKLVFILNKLDQGNMKWKERQLIKAAEIPDSIVRDQVIEDIEKSFTENELDYGRKLYLIENCIYGVDIQPIAVQIAKLRFFISLVVDQTVDHIKPNLGIRPLPNLESKFVAANTLIGVEKPQQMLLHNPMIDEKEKQLAEVRDSLFTARTPATKRKYRETDKQLRSEIATLLKNDGWRNSIAAQLSSWDPFDQNVYADFFDQEWMFGVIDGFDIVIGNPPYIDSEGMVNNGQQELRDYISGNYLYAKGNWDIYIAFFEKGFRLLCSKGTLIYITPDKWISRPFGNEFRKNLLPNIYSILISGRDVFDTVNVDSIVTLISKRISKNIRVFDYKTDEPHLLNEVDKKIIKAPYALDILFSDQLKFIVKIGSCKGKLSDLANCESACATSDAYKLKPFITNLNSPLDFQKTYYRVINTGTIDKYISKWGLRHMVYLGDRYLLPVVDKNRFNIEFNNSYGEKSSKSKIIIKGLTLLDACIDEIGDTVPGKSTLVICNSDLNILKLLAGLVNSKLAIYYIKEKYSASSYNTGINFTKDMINDFPLPEISQKTREKIIDKVSQILSIKRSNPSVNTYKLESELDNLVYELYGLTADEIAIVGDKKNDSEEIIPSLEEMNDEIVGEITEPEVIDPPRQSDYNLYKCGLCGKIVLGHDRANHSKEDHRGQDEWNKLKK